MSGHNNTKNYSIFETASNLAITCLIAGVIIAITFYITAPVAAEKNILLKNDAMKSLVDDADIFNEVKEKEGWYTAEKENKLIAYIVPSETKGYGGVIKVLVAITEDGQAIDFNIVTHNETPGLGDNASKMPFRAQFKGKGYEQLVVVKDPNNKENIQAMTGATISSKAVTNAVREAEKQVLDFKEGK